MFRKIKGEDKTKYDTFYWQSKAETVTDKTNTDDVFQSIYTAIV